jgi:hypothetical protein
MEVFTSEHTLVFKWVIHSRVVVWIRLAVLMGADAVDLEC